MARINGGSKYAPIERLRIYQVAEFALCKSTFLLIFYAQSAIYQELLEFTK